MRALPPIDASISDHIQHRLEYESSSSYYNGRLFFLLLFLAGPLNVYKFDHAGNILRESINRFVFLLFKKNRKITVVDCCLLGYMTSQLLFFYCIKSKGHVDAIIYSREFIGHYNNRVCQKIKDQKSLPDR